MHRIRLFAALAFAALLLAVPARPASLSGVVVSQVYAGGGNTGASFDHDFVELFNSGAGPADVNGWSIQYASAGSGTWQTTILAGRSRPATTSSSSSSSAASIGAALPVADADRDDEPGRLRRQGRRSSPTASRSPAAPPRVAARRLRPSRTSSATARRATTRARRRVGALSQLDRGRARRRRLHRHRLEPRRLLGRRADATQLLGPRVDLLGGPARRRGTSQAAGVDVDVQPVLSLSLERPTISFGSAFSGDTPTPISERVTVRQQQRDRLRARRCTAPCSRRPTCRSAWRAPLRPAERSARRSPAAPGLRSRSLPQPTW